MGQALSIQAHPDIELAKKLHAQDPKNYRDPNHKPEMTIALTPFEALCGFRPLREIVKFTEEVPELVQLVDPERVTALKEVASSKDEDLQKKTLKEFFARFITADKQLVKECITAFMNRLTSANRSMTELEDLCLRLNSQYPDEVGCFCVFILNYIEMEPGEAIFLAANEPHAYLSGECMECMAMSDNVVRAGLTPKFRDVETLVEMLTYKTYKKENLSMHPKQFSKHSLLFKPPVKEFAVIKTKLSLGEEETLKTEASDSILICIKGDMKIECSREEMAVSMGDILLLDANSDFKIISQSAESLLFLAFSQS